MRTSLRLTVIAGLWAALLMGQGSDLRRGLPVRGEITPMAPGTGGLTVELSGNGMGSAESVSVNPDGTFEFRSAHTGANELRVVSASGEVIHRETVVIGGSSQTLSIHLTEPSSANRAAGNTISMRQLTHKVPPQARKAFEKGEQAETKGNHEQSAEWFRQAVAIDPEFADAYNELGAVEAGQKNFNQAIDDFQKAIDAVPDHRLALANLSIVLAKAQRYGEAAVAARRALQIMPESGTIRYVLATSLLFAKGDSDEVLDNLVRSAQDIPLAHLMAAELLVKRGKRDQAIQHVEDYLRAVPADDKHRERAQAMLAELRP